jgi:hypothetical protein
MLKYGDISIINNGNSKSLIPRNITYRQKELFKTKMSESEILSTIQLSPVDIPNLRVIINDTFSNTSNVSIVYIDLIRKKTQSENQITINDKLLITDINDLNPKATFKYLFTTNGILSAESLDIQIQQVQIQDNVPYINSKFITEMMDNNERINYDSMISGFIFPQINDDNDTSITSGYKRYTGMLLMPANYYINKNYETNNIDFNKYLDNEYYFPEKKKGYKQSLRLIRTNYQFKNQSTFTNKLDFIKDADIVDLNLTDNLVNLEINNIAMRDGKFVLLTNKNFNPIEGSVANSIDLSANFSFWTSDLSGLKQLVKITSDNVSIFNPLKIEENIIIKKNGIQFGNTNEMSISDISNNNYIIFSKTNNKTSILTILDLSANLNLLNDTPFITLKTGKELIIKDTSNYIGFINDNIKIYQPLDLSANGIIKFGTNIKINNGTIDVISINSATIDSSANLNLLNDIPFITFKNTSELKIKDDLISYLGFNDNIIVYQPLDLSANGIIKFGTNIKINNGTTDVISINSATIDSVANLNLLNDTPFITLKTGKELIIKDTSNYIGFINNNIKIYQPLDLSANGIIKFGTNNLLIKNGNSSVIGSGWIFHTDGSLSFNENIVKWILKSNGDFTMGGDINVSGFAYISNYLTVVGNLNANSDILMTSNKILYTNNIYGYSIGYQTKIDLDNRFIDISNSSIDIIGTYVGFPHPSQTLTTTSKYMYIKPLISGDFEMRLLNVPNTVITTNLVNLSIKSQFSWNWYSTTGVQMAFIDPNATGVSSIVRFYGTVDQYIYYNASNNFGSYNSLTSTTIWNITSTGAITGSSLNLSSGSGTLTCGSINAKDIIGTSLNIGSGNSTITSTGVITGKSLNLGNGAITLVGNINSSGTITTGTDTNTIALLGETGIITIGSSVTPAIRMESSSGMVTATGGFMSPTGTITLGTGLNTITLTGNTGAITGDTLTLNGGIYAGDTITTNRGIYSIGTITVVGSSGGIIVQGNGGVNIDGSIIAGGGAITGKGIRSYGVIYADGAITSNGTISGKNGINVPILLDPTTTTGNRLHIYGVAGGTKYLFFNISNTLGLFNTSTGTNVWSIDGTTGNINTIGSISFATISCNSITPLSGTAINCNGLQWNWLLSSGINRIKMFPTITPAVIANILEIYRISDNVPNDGFWGFDNTGLFQYKTMGSTRWSINTNGDFYSNSSASTALNLSSGGINAQYMLLNGLGTTTINVPNGGINCNTINILNGTFVTQAGCNFRTAISTTCSPYAVQMANLSPTPFNYLSYIIDGNASGEGCCLYLNDNLCGINSTFDSGYQMIFFDEDSYPSYVGFAIAGTSIVSYSERRFKYNIKSLDKIDILDKFKRINFVQYNKKRPDHINKIDNPERYKNSKYKYSLINYGVIHDEIIDIFPDIEAPEAPINKEKDEKNEDFEKRKINYKNADKSKMVDYGRLNYYSYLAVQELIKQNEEIIKQNEKLTNRLDKQQEMMQNLMERLYILENK